MEDLEEPKDGRLRRRFLCQFELAWDGQKIVKDMDPVTRARIWRFLHCGNKWSGWNHTEALGHAIGGEEHQGLQEGATCLEKSFSWHCPLQE